MSSSDLFLKFESKKVKQRVLSYRVIFSRKVERFMLFVLRTNSFARAPCFKEGKVACNNYSTVVLQLQRWL